MGRASDGGGRWGSVGLRQNGDLQTLHKMDKALGCFLEHQLQRAPGPTLKSTRSKSSSLSSMISKAFCRTSRSRIILFPGVSEVPIVAGVVEHTGRFPLTSVRRRRAKPSFWGFSLLKPEGFMVPFCFVLDRNWYGVVQGFASFSASGVNQKIMCHQ